MREWLTRLVDWVRRDRLDRELNEELRFHREQIEREAAGAGAAPAEAAVTARRRLGQVTRHQEESRDRWSWPWLDHFFKDVRYALRGLRRSPGYTATVVLTLGLGIGANAAMFGVIDKLMFRPFPYLRDPSRVHRVYLRSTNRGVTRTVTWTEYTRYLDLTTNTASFDLAAAFTLEHLAIGKGASSRERAVTSTNASFWQFFDVKPALGRFFGPAEDQTPVGANVVVLGYQFWQTEFGGRDVLGQVLQVRDIPATIIGVTPRGFTGVDKEEPAAFIPITTFAGYGKTGKDQSSYYTTYNWGWLSVMVRRKPGVSTEAATADLTRAELKSYNTELAMDRELPPAAVANPAALVGPLKEAAGPGAGLESRTLLWVTGVAVVVLLIACANVCNLMLARMLRRRREIAVRLALGVSRRRLLAQGLTESLVLAGLGSLVGLAVAQWGGAALRTLYVADSGPLELFTDWRTLGVAALVAVISGVVTGLAPALLMTRGDLNETLKAGAREGTYQRSRIRSGLLVLQGALSVILLVGAGLFVKSLGNVRAMPMGYDAEPVLFATRELRGMALSDSERVALGRRLLATAQRLPGVEEAAWVSSIPFWSTSSTNLFVPGIDSTRRIGRFTFQTSTPGYFAAMSTRILRGRNFTEADRRGTPRVALVSEAMGKALWPGQDAIGQCMRVSSDTLPCTTVIGIVENAVQNSLLDEDRRFRYYMPMDQYAPTGGWALLIKVQGDPDLQLEPVRKALQAIMPGDAYVNVHRLESVIADERRSWQIGATMFVAFGVLALVVAAIGLYGVITYNVAQRMHELGVRIALGARNVHVIRLVVGQGIRFAVAGIGLGLIVALLVARWIQPLLFQQSARDAATYIGVGAVLLGVALLASWVPARRAVRADPNSALRSE